MGVADSTRNGVQPVFPAPALRTHGLVRLMTDSWTSIRA